MGIVSYFFFYFQLSLRHASDKNVTLSAESDMIFKYEFQNYC